MPRRTRYKTSVLRRLAATLVILAGVVGSARLASARRATPATVAPVAADASTGGLGMSAEDASVDVPADTHDCTRSLALGFMQPSMRGCYLNESVSSHPGTLRYPCAGGRAVASFGSQTFTGFVRNGVVDVQSSTTFPFRDGCTWRSTQRIRGNLAGGALAFTYSEAPTSANGRCAPPCTASARVSVR
jgi:hypothetical protein